MHLNILDKRLDVNSNQNKGIKTMSEAPKCGCGRSPTGNCIGWHALSEEGYQDKKAQYEAKKAKK